MTPDPDPDPPTPTGDPCTVYLTNSLNNTYMARIVKYVNSQPVVLTGGTAVIGQTNTLEFTIPEGSGSIVVYAKAYNNQYTSYDDSYYDDSSIVSSSINPNSWRNKEVDITINGVSNATISFRS